jgi:hypothetical protein
MKLQLSKKETINFHKCTENNSYYSKDRHIRPTTARALGLACLHEILLQLLLYA